MVIFVRNIFQHVILMKKYVLMELVDCALVKVGRTTGDVTF